MFETFSRPLKIVLFVLAIVLLLTLVFVVSAQRGIIGKKTATVVVTPIQSQSEIVPPPVSVEEPQRTDFGTKMPTDFPTDIPIEKGAQLQQSYSLEYPNQKQQTVVFSSTKTVKENYTLYSDFLIKNGWNIVETYESERLSSLHGNSINVTISEDISTATKSQMNINISKK